MKQLRDRVLKLREDFGHIYQLSRTEGKPSVNWDNIMDEKLVGVCASVFIIFHKDLSDELLILVDFVLMWRGGKANWKIYLTL